jgi:hypothetical protein
MHQMSASRATWDDTTCAFFLDLVEKQKELRHWARITPSKIGWSNITREFNANTRRGYHKKTLQNKYHDLKWNYFNWHDGQTHTGLGRDPATGEVAADPEWLDQAPRVLTTPFS